MDKSLIETFNVDKWVINKSYPLGQGQMATVFEGWDKNKPEIKYAIKQQCFEKLQRFLGERYWKFISREVKTMKAIQNENIVQIIDVKITQNNFYLVMELCENGNLLKRLESSPSGRLQEKEAVEIFKQIMKGYSSLNRAKVIHRDIKPENILFKGGVPKIADFGLAKIVENNQAANQQVTVTGTPYYRPPQLLIASEDVDIEFPQKIDIWSLGVVFYEMLVGKRPWDAESIEEYLDQIENNPVQFPMSVQVSGNTKDLIQGMLTIHEDYRFSYQDCMEHQFFKDEKIQEEEDDEDDIDNEQDNVNEQNKENNQIQNQQQQQQQQQELQNQQLKIDQQQHNQEDENKQQLQQSLQNQEQEVKQQPQQQQSNQEQQQQSPSQKNISRNTKIQSVVSFCNGNSNIKIISSILNTQQVNQENNATQKQIFKTNNNNSENGTIQQ